MSLPSTANRDALALLPSVDAVLQRLTAFAHLPHKLLVHQIRTALAERRQAILEGSPIHHAAIEQLVAQRLQRLLEPSLRPVLNATGVILHTNLGRAPLAQFHPIPRYSNLEYDLETGKRGKRDVHTSALLEQLLHRPAIVVNNNAAAVFLVLNELAAGQEVLVSRGELIEIGDGFRIPDIMARSGAILREVGTTNRTRLDDYRHAVTERTRLILRVHPSNFRMTGFTAQPTLSELAGLGKELGIPVYEDLGSGCLVDLKGQGIDEPLVADSFASPVNVVSFSCDKLLGGPQSGIIAGDAELVARMRRNQMYRAFRVDKLIVESLETTLRHLLLENWPAIPTLAMIFSTLDQIQHRALRVRDRLKSLDTAVRQDASAIGGGSTPDQTLPTWIVELTVPRPSAFERQLRLRRRPVIVRIDHDKIILDMRTVASDEEDWLVEALLEVAGPLKS